VEKRGETNFNIDCSQTSFYKRNIVSESIKWFNPNHNFYIIA
jgi:hypothetical protein